MKFHPGVKPALWGAAAGAVAISVIGFSSMGWMLGSKAERMASARAESAVIDVLTPICVEKFHTQADSAAKLIEFKKAASWDQRTLIEKRLGGDAGIRKDQFGGCQRLRGKTRPTILTAWQPAPAERSGRASPQPRSARYRRIGLGVDLMTLRRGYAPMLPEFDEFLFASVGEEVDGMPLSMLSALSRLGLDPRDEAVRLAHLTKEAAADQLARMTPGCTSGAGAHRKRAKLPAGLSSACRTPARPRR
jgi:hypothetical protein